MEATKPASVLPPKALIGMVHVGALPGTPFAREGFEEVVRRAVAEAQVLAAAGFDAVIVENMHDRPYIHAGPGASHPPETVACMTRLTLAVRGAVGPLPVGVQVLSGGAKEALAVALAAGASFIRCENFVFAHVADEGLLERAEAGPLLRYRRLIGAERIGVFCDVKKKHASHAVTADIPLAGAVEAAEFFGADGVIVSGTATGKACAPEDLAGARGATTLPVLVGSGVTPPQVAGLFTHADGLIVGSWIKAGGVWSGPLDAGRCREMASEVRRFRGG